MQPKDLDDIDSKKHLWCALRTRNYLNTAFEKKQKQKPTTEDGPWTTSSARSALDTPLIPPSPPPT